MDVRDTLSSLLPPPRDDEPARLRQDILDELSDHLTCAYHSELLRGLEPTVAKQRALNRFGEPAQVARRLWFDAMKGKIMAKRLLITACLLMTLGSLALMGLVWLQSGRATAQSIEVNRKLAEALVQAQAANHDMLKKLSEMSEAIKNPRSLEWNPLKFTLTDDTPDGPPVAGCAVTLSSRGGGHRTIVRTTDSSGVVDFGLVRPDDYSFQVSRKWHFAMLCGEGEISVKPGTEINLRIACPKESLEPVPLRIRCDWPADLKKERLVLEASFRFMPIKKDVTVWRLSTTWVTPTHSVLLGTDAGVREIQRHKALYLWTTTESAPSRTIRADIRSIDLRVVDDSTSPMKWERGNYRLTQLVVVSPRDKTPTSNVGTASFDVIAHCFSEKSGLGLYPIREKPPLDEDLDDPISAQMRAATYGIPGVRLGQEAWDKFAASFQTLADRPTEWVVTLPEPLITAVRTKLNRPATAP